MIFTEIFLIHILILISREQAVVGNQNYFEVFKNQDINLDESNLILTVHKSSKMQCIALCISNPKCLTAAYDNSQRKITNCLTYSRFFQSGELILSSSGVVYQKKKKNKTTTPTTVIGL
jgi:hypothetical protein